MASVNYIREMRAFPKFATENGLTSNERELWYQLFECFNEAADGSIFPDTLAITDKRLLLYAPFEDTKTLRAAIRGLCEVGLIDVTPSDSQRRPDTYTLHYLTAEKQDAAQRECAEAKQECDAANSESVPEKIGNDSGNIPENFRKDSKLALFIYNTGDKTENKNEYVDWGPSGVSEEFPAVKEEARAREELPPQEQAYMAMAGEFMTDGDIEKVRQAVASGRYSHAQIRKGLELVQGRTERGTVAHPAEYFKACLIDWEKRGIRTRDAIERDLAYYPDEAGACLAYKSS